ncbi:MAG: tetratricopeptide repeat protein, partial [Candidatus Obscuribacterales bacterium]|nr:tetratricopeptide repeat protein [Candidatus Obscuribacterales bacterium]
MTTKIPGHWQMPLISAFALISLLLPQPCAEAKKALNKCEPNPCQLNTEKAAEILEIGRNFLKENDYARAEEKLKQLLPSKDPDLLMDLAACSYKRGDYAEALRLCQEAQKSNSPARHYSSSMISLGVANCLYKEKLYKDAAASFQGALSELKKSDPGMVAELALEGLGACHMRNKDLEQAEAAFLEAAKLSRTLFGKEDINYAWVLYKLCDIYRANNKIEKASAYFDKAVWIFRETNYKRLLKEQENCDKKALRSMVFGRGDQDKYRFADKDLIQESKYLSITTNDVKLPECAWANQFRQVEAPGWVWSDPNVTPKAV